MAEIQVGAPSDIATPSSGYRTLFINTSAGNALYYKFPDGTSEPASIGAGDSEGIASDWMEAIKCALDSGKITAQQFQDIINTGIVISSSSNTDTNGNVTTEFSVGAKNVALTSITLDVSTFSGSAAATHQIGITWNPTNTSDKTVTYSSSNTAKATVSATGLITLVATGTCVISVIPNSDPSKVQYIAVTVS